MPSPDPTINGQEPFEPEFLGWRLVLTIAGSNHHEIVEIGAEDKMELEPTHHDVQGLTFERYTDQTDDGDGEWVEYRFDYIVSRKLEAVYSTPEPEPASANPDEEDTLGHALEDRLRERGDKDGSS